MNKEKRTNKSGFSLLELIVVISIMAVLGGVLAPQLVRYVNSNRATACKTDREAILAVYERCIYRDAKDLSQNDLDAILDGTNVTTWDEVKQYMQCPSGGTYTGEISGDVAVIHCSVHCDGEHDDVATDFLGWTGTEVAETIDASLPPAPPEDEPETDEPDSEEETTTEEEKEEKSYWPYMEDERWDGNRFPGQYVDIDAPSKLFTSKDGNKYVIIDKPGNPAGPGKYRVFWEWSLGPENIDTRGWEQCVSWSGVIIEDVETIRFYREENGVYVPKDAITGIHYGDILYYEGYRYIYGSHDEHLEKPFPIPGQNGNNFYLIASDD